MSVNGLGVMYLVKGFADLVIRLPILENHFGDGLHRIFCILW